MTRGPDAGTLLARALEGDAEKAGCAVRVVDSAWTRWASATFTGARHHLTLEADETPLFQGWLTALPETDLTIRGLLVADMTVTSLRMAEGVATLALEALTVES